MISPLEYISIFSVLLPCIMVFVSWGKIKKPLKVISVLVFFTLIMEASGLILFYHGLNNLWLFHLFTWVESALIYYYLFILVKDRNYRIVFTIPTLAFFALSTYLLIAGIDTESYNSTQRSIGSIWACVLCFAYFFYLVKELRVEYLRRFPHYVMVSAFLLYFAGMLFVNLLQDYNIAKKSFGFDIYLIHSGLNILLNLAYVFVLFLGMRESYNPHRNNLIIDDFE